MLHWRLVFSFQNKARCPAIVLAKNILLILCTNYISEKTTILDLQFDPIPYLTNSFVAKASREGVNNINRVGLCVFWWVWTVLLIWGEGGGSCSSNMGRRWINRVSHWGGGVQGDTVLWYSFPPLVRSVPPPLLKWGPPPWRNSFCCAGF